jgi:hypothetical protein
MNQTNSKTSLTLGKIEYLRAQRDQTIAKRVKLDDSIKAINMKIARLVYAEEKIKEKALPNRQV